jgi:adenosine kinase
VTLRGRFPQIFVLSPSAPFIARVFSAQPQEITPYIDNEVEAEAQASANGLPDPKDLPAIARAFAKRSESDPTRDRVVILPHGAHPTVSVSSRSPDDVNTYAVNVLRDEGIVGTNGAGGAFVGGLLGAFVVGRSLNQAIEVFHALGTICVMQVEPQCKRPKVKVLQ